MTNYQRFGLITGQVYLGLALGLMGAIAAALLSILYYVIIGTQSGMFEVIMLAVIGGYIGIQTGIGITGYRFLNSKGRQKEFLRYLVQSFIGLILALLIVVLLIIPFSEIVPGAFINFFAISLPLMGPILGFNFGLKINKIENVKE